MPQQPTGFIPDGFVPDEPKSAPAAEGWPSAYPKLATATRGALATLPVMGAALGGMAAGVETAGLAAVPGLALGAGVGQGLRDLIAHTIGLEKTTPTEKGINIVREVGTTGALAAILPGLIEAAKTPGRSFKEAVRMAIKPLTQSPGRSVVDLTNAILEEVPAAFHETPANLLVRPAWQTWVEDAAKGPSDATIAALRQKGVGDASINLMRQGAAPAVAATTKAAAQAVAGPTMGQVVSISPQMIRNQLGIAARRAGIKLTDPVETAATALMQKGTPAADALTQALSAGKTMLTAGEAKLVDAMSRRGASDEEIQAAIKAARAFNAKFGLAAPSRKDILFPKGMRGAPSGAGGMIP